MRKLFQQIFECVRYVLDERRQSSAGADLAEAVAAYREGCERYRNALKALGS